MCDTCGCKGAETFDVEGFGRWKNRMKKEATQRKFIEMTKNAILRLKVLESVLNEHNLERNLNKSSIVELEDALKEINEITMWLIKNNGSFYTAGKKFGFFEAEDEEDEEDWEYHVYVSDSPNSIGFIEVSGFEVEEDAIKAAHEVSKDERGKGKTVYVVAEEREMDIEEVIYEINEDGDVMRAEGFDAENLSFKERIEKMIDVASPKFKGIKGFGKRIGAKQGKKLDYKIQGILPRAKGVSSYRRNIETPKWYKGIQLGLMTGLAGFITYKLATDGSKEE